MILLILKCIFFGYMIVFICGVTYKVFSEPMSKIIKNNDDE